MPATMSTIATALGRKSMTRLRCIGAEAGKVLRPAQSLIVEVVAHQNSLDRVDWSRMAPMFAKSRFCRRTQALAVIARQAPALLQHPVAVSERNHARVDADGLREQLATALLAVLHRFSKNGKCIDRDLREF